MKFVFFTKTKNHAWNELISSAKKAKAAGRSIGVVGLPRYLSDEQELKVTAHIRDHFLKGDALDRKVLRKVMALVKEGRDVPARVEDIPPDLNLPSMRIAKGLMKRCKLKEIAGPSRQTEKRMEGDRSCRKC